LRALFQEARLLIIDLLSERAATTSQLADALGRPKGTVGHHLKVLERAGLVRVVRTEMVRAIEARYYGRTARTFDMTPVADSTTQPNLGLATAIKEMSESSHLSTGKRHTPGMSTVRHARIPEERAREWEERLLGLVEEFIASPREGDIVYGLVIALYPTDRPHLP
jgi:DNA-binding transcriptional ArsR family regulator